MVVSSLVVTLSPDATDRQFALAMLAAEPCLTLGERTGARLPAVAETSSTELGVELCESLGRARGVMRVDVVAIDFSQEVP